MFQHRVSRPPQLEVLEQRQVLSGLALLLSGASLTAATTSLLGQSPRSESTTPSQVHPMIDLAASSAATIPLSGGVIAIASLGGGTEGDTGQATPLLNLGLSLNLLGGTTTGSGGTSSGAEGTGAQVTIHIPITPNSVPSSGTDSAVAAAASRSLTSVSSPMVPTAIGIPPQAGLSTLTQTTALATADEDVQPEINSFGRPEQGEPQQEKDAVDEIEAAPASNLLPGRPASSPSPTSPNTDEESAPPRGETVIPLLLEPEAFDAPDGSPWFFQLPETLGLDKLCPNSFGPINNLKALFLEDLRSISRPLEQVMEWTEVDGFSASSWLLLVMAGLAACEIARRQFRENSSTDALEEPAEGPALV